eukprot:CAMPEP_0174903774 /NCGR_PEP_ID=MMETSP0167-20121228/45481_1 /TAXON_ID=38298 /ORGANISM="Rhodella maculata, Strain CCMP736" /LENGTH=112 /DNA_ID=CAMNT_0016146197 /DNA_START=153 /DNA_END=491 /DNA_ORIENTATION=-
MNPCFVAPSPAAALFSRARPSLSRARPAFSSAPAPRRAALRASAEESSPEKAASASAATTTAEGGVGAQPEPSFIKLAMRNMVYQGAKSLLHFGMTFGVLLAFLCGVAFLTK